MRKIRHHASLLERRFAEDGVERGHHRHAQVAQQRQHVAARLAAEDAVFVLEAEDVDPAHVQEVARAAISGEIALRDFEAHALAVSVAFAGVVHRQHRAIEIGELGRNCGRQVGRESGVPQRLGI
jgi:hypothetical protein